MKLTPGATELLQLMSRGQITAFKGPQWIQPEDGSAGYASEPRWIRYTRTDRTRKTGVFSRVSALIDAGLAQPVETEQLGDRHAKGVVELTDAGREALGVEPHALLIIEDLGREPLGPLPEAAAMMDKVLQQERIQIEPVQIEPEWDPARGPQYSYCIHCKGLIRRHTPEGAWINPGVLGTVYLECDKAPNPDDGPMPGHEPGTIVSPPPEEPVEHVDQATLPKPVIPRIPKTGF